MTRVGTVPAGRRRRKKVLKMAKGNFGGRSKLYRTAKETVQRALVYNYESRRLKKRNFRSLWITRITAACKAYDIAYSRFMHGLASAKVEINRKMLSEIAIHDEAAFAKLVDVAKGA